MTGSHSVRSTKNSGKKPQMLWKVGVQSLQQISVSHQEPTKLRKIPANCHSNVGAVFLSNWAVWENLFHASQRQIECRLYSPLSDDIHISAAVDGIHKNSAKCWYRTFVSPVRIVLKVSALGRIRCASIWRKISKALSSRCRAMKTEIPMLNVTTSGTTPGKS